MAERQVKKYLFDTGSAGDWINFRGTIRERANRAIASGQRIGISTPVLGELWAGTENSKSKKRNLPRLLACLSALVVWPYDEVAAREFGRIQAELLRLGRPIGQIDIQTAAIAFTLGSCTVVSKDQDFKSVPGLKVVDWSE